MTFSQDDYDRLSGGPGCERGFLWSDAIELANKCDNFEEAFIEVITGLVAGRQHLTSNLQSR
eukprot:12217594-Heterocapsa_arctica.AAC.1